MRKGNSAASSTITRPGLTLTAEAGIYCAGLWGVRVAENVAVLTAYPRGLRSLRPGTSAMIAVGDSPEPQTFYLFGIPWPSIRRGRRLSTGAWSKPSELFHSVNNVPYYSGSLIIEPATSHPRALPSGRRNMLRGSFEWAPPHWS